MTGDAALVERLREATAAAVPFAVTAVHELRARLAQACADTCIPDPPFDIVFRIKTPEAMEDKLVRRGPHSPGGRAINDFIGIRILTIHAGCLPVAESSVMAWGRDIGLRPVLRHDTVDRPQAAGYRSTHLDFEFEDAAGFALPPEASVEIQLETWLQHVHAMMSHRYYYKRSEVDPALVWALTELSAQLDLADRDLRRVGAILENPQVLADD